MGTLCLIGQIMAHVHSLILWILVLGLGAQDEESKPMDGVAI